MLEKRIDILLNSIVNNEGFKSARQEFAKLKKELSAFDIASIRNKQNMAGFNRQFISMQKNLQPLKEEIRKSMEGWVQPSITAEQAAEGIIQKQKQMASWSKTMKAELEQAGLERLGSQYKGFFGAMKMGMPIFREFDDGTGKLNKEMMKEMGIMGKLGMNIRWITHGFRGFRMEMLGVMFFGMGIERFFMSLLGPSLELAGATDLLRTVLGAMFIDTGLLADEWILKLWDGWDSLSKQTQELISDFMVLGVISGILLAIIGGLALGLGSLIYFLSDTIVFATALKYAFRGIVGVLAIGFALKFLFDIPDEETLGGVLKKSLHAAIAAAIAALVLGGGVYGAVIAFSLTLTAGFTIHFAVDALKAETLSAALLNAGLASVLVGAIVAFAFGLTAGIIAIPITALVVLTLRWITKGKFDAEEKLKKEAEASMMYGGYTLPTYPGMTGGLPEYMGEDKIMPWQIKMEDSFQKVSASGEELKNNLQQNSTEIITSFDAINESVKKQDEKIRELTPKITDYYGELDISAEILNELEGMGLEAPVNGMESLATAAERLNSTGIAEEMIKLQKEGMAYSLKMKELDLSELKEKYRYDLRKLEIREGVDDFIAQGNTITPINPNDEIIGVKSGGSILTQINSALNNIFARLDINITAPSGYEATARLSGGI